MYGMNIEAARREGYARRQELIREAAEARLAHQMVMIRIGKVLHSLGTRFATIGQSLQGRSGELKLQGDVG